MDLITDPTASLVLPAIPDPPAGNRGYYTEGLVGVTPATDLRAWVFNMILIELVTLVQGAGLTPNPNNTGQVLAAVQALINPGSLITENGYYIFPGGLTLQWQSLAVTPGLGPVDFTLPIGFQSANFGCVASIGAGIGVTPQPGSIGCSPSLTRPKLANAIDNTYAYAGAPDLVQIWTLGV